MILLLQITEKLELLLTEREGLYATWEDHKTELDQAYDLHVFLRDAKQIDTFTSTQEVLLFACLFLDVHFMGLFHSWLTIVSFCWSFNNSC